MSTTIKTNLVPCGDCTACCETDLVFLHPECGDKIEEYKTVKLDNRYALKSKSNGECFYLAKGKGCLIYDRRPTVCRELDCKIFLEISPMELALYLKQGLITRKILKAAKNRVKRDTPTTDRPI